MLETCSKFKHKYIPTPLLYCGIFYGGGSKRIAWNFSQFYRNSEMMHTYKYYGIILVWAPSLHANLNLIGIFTLSKFPPLIFQTLRTFFVHKLNVVDRRETVLCTILMHYYCCCWHMHQAIILTTKKMTKINNMQNRINYCNLVARVHMNRVQ